MLDLIFQAVNALWAILVHGGLEIFISIISWSIFPINQDEIFRLEEDDEKKR